jgi:CRP/FNR family transcriptional regulator
MTKNYDNSTSAEPIQDETVVDHESLSRSGDQIWSSASQVLSLLKIDDYVESSLVENKYQHIKFKKNKRICLAGKPARNLFVVHSGYLKTSWSDANGYEKILNFPMRGDIIGLNSIVEKKYQNDVVSLSDVDLIVVPSTIDAFHDKNSRAFSNRIIEVLLKELIASQYLEHQLSKLRGEARVAKFLLLMGEKHSSLGYSRLSFNLLMTREDIGSYLGLTLASVSRILSEFNQMGIVTVIGKSIQINDQAALERLRNMSEIRAPDG